MMPLQSETPRPGLRRDAKDCEREAVGGTLASPITSRGQHILQRHYMFRLLQAARGQDRRQELPGGGLLHSAHLFQSQARLYEVAAAEVIPGTPFRPIPSERGSLALIRFKPGKELVCASQKIRRAAEPCRGDCWRRVGGGGRGNQSGAGEHDVTTIRLCGKIARS